MTTNTSFTDETVELPLLPLRDVVVFPHMVIPLFVGRPKSIRALELAMESDRRIMLVAQKTASKDEPSVGDMFGIGCISSILQMLKLPDGTVKVLVEGLKRAGPKPTREKVHAALESLRKFDLGGLEISYGPDDHSGLDFADLAIIGTDGRFRR